MIAAPDNATATPEDLKLHGPGVDLADSTLLELAGHVELTLAERSGKGDRFAELINATLVDGLN